jgi:hypothetical protein
MTLNPDKDLQYNNTVGQSDLVDTYSAPEYRHPVPVFRRIVSSGMVLYFAHKLYFMWKNLSRALDVQKHITKYVRIMQDKYSTLTN